MNVANQHAVTNDLLASHLPVSLSEMLPYSVLRVCTYIGQSKIYKI